MGVMLAVAIFVALFLIVWFWHDKYEEGWLRSNAVPKIDEEDTPPT